MKQYLTSSEQRLECWELRVKPCPVAPEMQLVKLYPHITFQEIIGFGGALTEASGYVYAHMRPEQRDEFMQLYFSDAGNRYSLGRLSIQSCDFSLGPRAYLPKANADLKGFSINDDFAYIIPFALDTLSANPRTEFLASPWSPPAWAKTNRSMKRGGRLSRKHYQLWANMVARFTTEYRALGIPVTHLTAQNEPGAVQSWESCLFSATEERAFLTDHLKPALRAAGLDDVKVLAWDHNKEGALDRTLAFLSDERAAREFDGIAFHWYSGDHFEALRLVRDLLGPNRELVFSEGCDYYSAGDPNAELPHAEHYAHEVIGDLQAGANAILDWNLLLDEQGGPNHVGNFCDAPIMYDRDAHALNVRLPYYYLGHFSRFIERGARRIMSTCYTSALETVAFANPSGSHALVALNRTENTVPFSITWGANALDRRIATTSAPPRSIQTIVW